LIFQSLPPGTKSNRPPSEGLQFFGGVKIDQNTKVMIVTLRNLAGETVYSVDLPPER
jgi:alkaline phosphatase D